MMFNVHAPTPAQAFTVVRVALLILATGLAFGMGAAAELVPVLGGLCALTVITAVPAVSSAPQGVVSTAEAVVAAVAMGWHGDVPNTMLLYLVVPCLVAGVRAGGPWLWIVVAAECVGLATGALLAPPVDGMAAATELTAPWLLTGAAGGYLARFMRDADSQTRDDQTRYEFAHRLLGQLRSVSRRLSSGLDADALAEQMLEHTMDELSGARAQTLVSRDGKTLSPIASTGEPFGERLEDDVVVQRCWQTHRPDSRLVNTDGQLRWRTALPLKVGARFIGVVLVDGTTAVERRSLSRLRSYLEEQSLRLEAALLFDEVRSTATLEERHRLAREIHDGVAQEIASLGYLTDELAASADTPQMQQASHDLRRELSRIVSELRLSIFDLRSNVSPHAGLGLALSDYAREVGSRAGMTVHLALSAQPQRLPLHVETELLRIAQEAITNARRHARASNLWVTFNMESAVVVMRIEDDGIGSAEVRDNHYGLRIMQERADRIGAELSVYERPRGGTAVVVTIWAPITPHLGAAHGHHSHAG